MQPENSRQTQKMADNASSPSPQKPLQPSSTAIDPNPPNPNLPSAQIPPSPSMDLPSISSPQLPQLIPSGALSVQPQRQNSSSSASSFQIQPNNLQRSGTMPMLSQIQPQAWMYGGGGQMNFGAAAAAAAAAGMARSGMIGQTAAQLNLQAQMLGQTRQKAGLVQGMQLRPSNSSGQGMQGMQAMGMMGSLANSQIRANGAFAYGQRFNQQGQARQQQLLPQMALTSPQKLQGQSLPRGSSFATMNPQFAGLTQNGQSALQNSLSQQQWLKQMQSTMSTPASPSHSLQQQQQQQQRQQQAFLAQLPSPQAHQKSMGLTQLGSPRQHQAQQQHLINQQQLQQLQQFQQQHQQQQQSPRRQTSAVQKSLSLTGSQPDTPASVTTTLEGSSQGAEASNQLLGKRKIQDLVSQVDSLGKLDPGVEDLLLEIADDFIDSVTAFACSLAKHRKSSTLESKDLLLHLEKNWQLSIPGFTREGQNHQKESLPSDAHRTRLEMIRTLIKPQQLGRDVCEEETAKQAGITSAMDHQIRPSPSSEQFLAAAASQMLQKVPRF